MYNHTIGGTVEKKSPLIVGNGKVIKRHSKNNRDVNNMKDNRQTHTRDLWSEEFESKLRAFDIARKVVEDYCKINKKSRKKTTDLLLRITCWLVFNPHEYLQNHSKHLGMNRATVKKLIDVMESLGYIKVLAGWSKSIGAEGENHWKAFPQVIIATDELLNMKINSK
mgnify:CR=1 FL=1